MDPDVTHRQSSNDDISDAVAALLEPMLSNIKRDYIRREIETIVSEAITLDEMFCSQQAWYRLLYPLERRDASAEDGVVCSVNSVTNSGKGSERKKEGPVPGVQVPYIFVISPFLHRTGGRRGEGYGDSDGVVLEPARVYSSTGIWSRLHS